MQDQELFAAGEGDSLRWRVERVALTEEEKLVAELELLGVRYLSRQTSYQADRVRSPDALLADLIRQPSARVRSAVIAVLLLRPEYAEAMPAALERLRPLEQWTLQFFYAAAVLLQQEHANQLQPFMSSRWRWLPDVERRDTLAKLGLPTVGTPREKLAALSREHQRRTQATVNWVGTCENVVQQLLHRWELEIRWNQ